MKKFDLNLTLGDVEIVIAEETKEFVRSFISADNYQEIDTDEYKIIIIKKSARSL